MAVAPCGNAPSRADNGPKQLGNGYLDDHENDSGSGSEDDSDSDELHQHPVVEDPRLALACDDGCVRMYSILEDELVYIKSLPRVSGEISTLLHICF